MEIKIKKLKEGVKLPEYKTESAGCLDVYLPEDTIVYPKFESITTVIPLGFSIVIPEGYTGRLNLRSSVFRDYPLVSFEGIIDSDFRGEVCLYVKNLSNQVILFEEGTRICQLDITARHELEVVEEVKELPKTKRGSKSGSTGKE